MIRLVLALVAGLVAPGGGQPVGGVAATDTGRVTVPPTAAESDTPAGPRRLQRFGELDALGRPEAAVPGPQASAVWPEVPGAAATGDVASPLVADTPGARRPRAVQHSDAYYTRLEIHRIGSYAILPLFGAEYALGQDLLTNFHPASWVRPAHRVVAYGVAATFGVNTVTGVWNLAEARHDQTGVWRRRIHVLSMLAADAGFVATGATARQAKLTSDGARRHRNLALASIGLSTASTVYMWLTK